MLHLATGGVPICPGLQGVYDCWTHLWRRTGPASSTIRNLTKISGTRTCVVSFLYRRLSFHVQGATRRRLRTGTWQARPPAFVLLVD
jgi:hypothetical protein